MMPPYTDHSRIHLFLFLVLDILPLTAFKCHFRVLVRRSSSPWVSFRSPLGRPGWSKSGVFRTQEVTPGVSGLGCVVGVPAGFPGLREEAGGRISPCSHLPSD